MNILFDLPSTLEAGRILVAVRTGAAFWIWLSARMAELGDERGASLLAQAIDGLEYNGQEIPLWALPPDESRAVFERLLWFMRGGNDAPVRSAGRKTQERLLDYEKDLDALYAAFLQSYGIDLYADSGGFPLVRSLHWWRFLALANNLPAGSSLVDYYMHYRGFDVSRLPRKTPAEKKYVQQVIDIKRQVRLDGKPGPQRGPVKHAEAPYIRKARELKESGVDK